MQTLAERDAELTAKHNEIWSLMGLSADVGAELNAVVHRVHEQMVANRDRAPEEYRPGVPGEQAAGEHHPRGVRG